MQGYHRNHQDPADLRIRRTDNRPQISDQEHSTPRKSQGHKCKIQGCSRAPADERNYNPDAIRIAVKSPALYQRCTLGTEPF